MQNKCRVQALMYAIGVFSVTYCNATPLFTWGLGRQNVCKKDQALQVQVEYLSDTTIIGGRWIAGSTWTDKRSLYMYSGLLWDIPLGDSQLLLTPAFTPGLYYAGDGKDLGHAIEFLSRIGLAYQIDGGGRVGFYFGHMSNASISSYNPGQEMAMFYLGLIL